MGMVFELENDEMDGFVKLTQGSKLGWSCGPSLPELLSDHQIVLGGGPVVYWKLLTINFDNILKISKC